MRITSHTPFSARASGWTAALAALLMATVPADGQESAPAPGTDQQRDRQEILQEFNQVRQELNEIQRQAMQDEDLQERSQGLNEAIEEAIVEEDPEAEEKLDRLDEVQGEIETAQQEQDAERLQGLMQEAQQIQQSLQGAQQQVLAREQIREEVQAFEEAVIAEMKEVDPRTEELIERMETLQAELQGQSPSPGS